MGKRNTKTKEKTQKVKLEIKKFNYYIVDV